VENPTVLIIDDGDIMTAEQVEAAIAQIEDAPADAVIAVDIETIPAPAIAIVPRQTKCEHGVYIPADEFGTTSRYCNVCNPDANGDTVHSAAMKRRKPPTRPYIEPETDDVAEYMARPVGERISVAEVWE
jgi:hypothetical protein